MASVATISFRWCDERSAALVMRLIDQGLHMADHPGIAFHDSLAHGHVACLVRGPDVAEVIDVFTAWGHGVGTASRRQHAGSLSTPRVCGWPFLSHS